MLRRIVEGSARNPLLVALAVAGLLAWGSYAIVNTPLDAIPDLSDVQVIVFTEYPGQAPQVVEDQVTYPLSTAMLAVPQAEVVRGYSFFGFSFVYIIFEDGTDLYWARSRVLESLNFVAGRLPDGVTPTLGPDATGVGWVYEYALVDRTGQHDLAELRSIQDWHLRYELQTVPGVAEVASVGGHVRQYQVEAGSSSSRLKRSSWYAGAATLALRKSSSRSPSARANPARRFCFETWRVSLSARSFAAGSRTSTARGKWRLAWSSCASVKTHSRRSRT
jgi:Cu(I)/Ag(I) efflux system membrane protein CusA/SilA